MSGGYPSGRARLVAIYGESYTMDDVCRGCQQRHRCADCLDGTVREHLPPSALARIEEIAARKAAERTGGCQVLTDTSGRVIGFACRRGR